MRQRKSRTTTPLGGKAKPPEPKHIPFPSLIDGGLWNVEESRGPVYIDRTNEVPVMVVPFGGEDVERKLRLHEQAHVAYTPNVTDRDLSQYASPLTIQACEDARIIQLMNDHSPAWKRVNMRTNALPPWALDRLSADLKLLSRSLTGEKLPPHEKPMRLLEAARTIASVRGYYEWDLVSEAMGDVDLDWIADDVETLHETFIGSKDSPTFEDSLEYANELERHFTELQDKIQAINSDMENANLDGRFLDPDVLDEDNGHPYRWGDMEIEVAPLPSKLEGDPSRRPRATDVGYVPRYMHRTLTDQRVFGRRRKHRSFQGTVLIDHSGSMSLSMRQVDEMMYRWPAVTIATYSGWGSGEMHGGGILRIIAHKGRRAEAEWLRSPAGQGNCVDGPALDWLCKQKGPRIWISDGHVSGKGEDFRPWYRVDAARKVVRGKIKRLNRVQDLLNS